VIIDTTNKDSKNQSTPNKCNISSEVDWKQNKTLEITTEEKSLKSILNICFITENKGRFHTFFFFLPYICSSQYTNKKMDLVHYLNNLDF
jgi:hypothetical protein